jgi:hypothetical protein
MLIVLGLYVLLVWLLFSRFHIRWGWGPGTLTFVIGALMNVLGPLQFLYPDR